MKIHLSLLSIVCCLSLQAQSVKGQWKTIDDNTGKPRSVVEIYERDGKVYGKIVRLFRGPDEDQDPVCTACTGDKQGQKIIGMEIINGLKYDKSDKEYEDGTILDPESGSTYDCKIWLGSDGKLNVRGYVMFFYRTQTWLPYEE